MAGDIGNYVCMELGFGPDRPVYILDLWEAAPAPPVPPPQVLNIVPDNAGGFFPLIVCSEDYIIWNIHNC